MSNKVYMYHNSKNEKDSIEIIKLNCKRHSRADIELSLNNGKCTYCHEDCMHSGQSVLVYIGNSDRLKTLMGFICRGYLDRSLIIQYGIEKELVLAVSEYNDLKDRYKNRLIELPEKENS